MQTEPVSNVVKETSYKYSLSLMITKESRMNIYVADKIRHQKTECLEYGLPLRINMIKQVLSGAYDDKNDLKF